MNYTFRHQLTNDDIRIQNKARYFADFFEATYGNYGRFGFPDLESQRSLLDKIRFRLLHYSKSKHGAFSKYINHYLSNKLISATDTLVEKHYPELLPLLTELSSELYKEDLNRHSLILRLETVLEKMKLTLFQNAFEGFNTILHCLEDLDQHQHIYFIEYYTAVISAELIFSGFPEKDTNKILERLLSNEVFTLKNRIESKFPLPQDLLDKRLQLSPEDYRSDVENFLNNRTLTQQFAGLKNLYESKPVESKLLFRIANLKSKNEVLKKFGEVTLTTRYDNYLIENPKEHYDQFFQPENQVFLEVIVAANDLHRAEKLAVDAINQELPRFESYFGLRMFADFSEFIREFEGRYEMKTSYASRWLYPREHEDWEDPNIKIEGRTSAAASDFLHLEKIYALAMTSTIPDQKLNHYWRYIESSFIDQDQPWWKLIDLVSVVVAHMMISRISVPLEVCLSNIIIGNTDAGIQTSQGHLGYHELRKLISTEDLNTTWLIETNELINSPFITHHLEAYRDQTIADLLAALRTFYKGLLLEAYEQRNYIQHSGISNDFALIKLEKCLPTIVENFRYAISLEIMKSETITFSDILEKLGEPNEKIRTMIDEGLKFVDL